MSIATAELFKKALDLDEKDRADLAGLLISSLDAGSDEGVEEAWRAEVARRLSELETGAASAISWAELRDRLIRRIDGR